MKRPIESDYTSHVAYARALEEYCDTLAQPAQEPVAWIEHYQGSIAYNPYKDAAKRLPDGVRFNLYTTPPAAQPAEEPVARIAVLEAALNEIASAGMSPSPEMSDDGKTAWHASQAWRFIGIAARAIELAPAPVGERCCYHDSDCAVHNMPAYPAGPCDCSLASLAQPAQEPVIGTKTWFEDGKIVTQNLYHSDIYTTRNTQEEHMTHTIDSTGTAAVATDYYWILIDEHTPRGVKLQLLGQGGVAQYSNYHGDSFWSHWAPLPKRTD